MAKQRHAWFTDASAVWENGKRCWKAAAFNSDTKTILQQQGSEGSSQYAELVAVHLVLEQEEKGAHISTDRWAVANGMAVWLPKWKENDWNFAGKPLWGKIIWRGIWEKARCMPITVYHMDAHMKNDSDMILHHNTVDQIVQVKTVTPPVYMGT
ncbi:ribonuclease H-like [Rhinoraja longicauda]